MDWQRKKEIPDFLKDYEKLDDYKMSLLDELKGEIFNTQKKGYKERLKIERKKEKKEEQKLDFEQMKLF